VCDCQPLKAQQHVILADLAGSLIHQEELNATIVVVVTIALEVSSLCVRNAKLDDSKSFLVQPIALYVLLAVILLLLHALLNAWNAYLVPIRMILALTIVVQFLLAHLLLIWVMQLLYPVLWEDLLTYHINPCASNVRKADMLLWKGWHSVNLVQSVVSVHRGICHPVLHVSKASLETLQDNPNVQIARLAVSQTLQV